MCENRVNTRAHHQSKNSVSADELKATNGDAAVAAFDVCLRCVRLKASIFPI